MEQALVALAAAVVAVSATEWAVRVRERRRIIEAATLEVAILVPYVIGPLSRVWKGPRPDTGLGSEWSQRRERLESLLVETRARSGWPLRRHRAVRREAEDLLARVVAAQLENMHNGELVPADEFPEISAHALRTAVFGNRPPLDHTINFYRRHGYSRRPGR